MVLDRLPGVDPIHTVHKPHQRWGRRGAHQVGVQWTEEMVASPRGGPEGREELLTQSEVNGQVLVIIGLSQVTEREKSKMTPGTTPAPGFWLRFGWPMVFSLKVYGG